MVDLRAKRLCGHFVFYVPASRVLGPERWRLCSFVYGRDTHYGTVQVGPSERGAQTLCVYCSTRVASNDF